MTRDRLRQCIRLPGERLRSSHDEGSRTGDLLNISVFQTTGTDEIDKLPAQVRVTVYGRERPRGEERGIGWRLRQAA